MIVEFEEIKAAIDEIYHLLLSNEEGEVADYIPQLAKVNPDLFGISVCTVKGDQYSIGDTDINFCLQSCSKPLNYCIAREKTCSDVVHSHVGYEPSGQSFNAFVLDGEGHPHNPMINAGAIMVCSLLSPKEEPAERFEEIRQYLYRMAGKTGSIGFDNSVFLSEKRHADRNYALAYYMNENGAFPQSTNLEETLDLYFQACSITVNANTGGVFAATLANGGVCPLTQEKIYGVKTVRDCLSLMYQCGMYDYSGQFAFKIGLPAKSGVSGCLFLVIPNEMGICIWSPRLDKMGNTVRGVKFCHELIKRFPFHLFHNIVFREKTPLNKNMVCQLVITAAATGNIDELKTLIKDHNCDLNCSDYDRRTALHLAAAEGHLAMVKYLVENGADVKVQDRWGNTVYHEAKKLLNDKGETEESIKELCEYLRDKV